MESTANNDGAGDFVGSEDNPYLSLGKSPGILSAVSEATENSTKEKTKKENRLSQMKAALANKLTQQLNTEKKVDGSKKEDAKAPRESGQVPTMEQLVSKGIALQGNNAAARATVMPQTNNDLIPKEADKANKDYCQLCYKGFGVFTFRYHCRPCGRTCCADCSLQVKVRMSVAVGQPSNYRVCEYCDIKTENPQLEEYYKLECQLRQSDQEVVVEKIKWLKKTSKELDRQITQQREDISLLQASSKR